MTLASIPSVNASSSSLFPLEKDMRVLFYELGVVGVNNLLGYESLLLFTELHQAEPEAPYPLVGLGLLAMATGDAHGAKQHFNHPIVLGSPLAPYAQGYLAMTYKLNGNAGGFQEASEAAKAASNEELYKALDEIENVVIDLSQR